MHKKNKIAGWAKFPEVETHLTEVKNQEDLVNKFNKSAGVIARGNGMSYGDISFNDQHTFDTRKLKKLIFFDEENLNLEYESGVLLSEINHFINPKGYKLFVIPGTKYITLGGAVACDVHGKNQTKFGAFCNHVISFKLLIASGDIISCSPTENTDYFHATIGGVGLTGVIISVKFKVRKLTSNVIFTTNKKTNSIPNIVSLFKSSNSEYKAAWIKNKNQILYTEGDYIEGELKKIKTKSRNIKFNFLGVFTTKIALKLVEFFLYKKAKKGTFKQEDNKFLHPLDELLNWNKLYPKGFIQVQFLVNEEHIEKAIEKTFSFIKQKKLTSFLTTLKQFNDIKSLGLMSFVKQGFVFSIDIKYRKNLESDLVYLADEIVKMGGRFYLAKDSFLSEKHLVCSYDDYPNFKQFINKNNKGKIVSSFSKRVNLHL